MISDQSFLAIIILLYLLHFSVLLRHKSRQLVGHPLGRVAIAVLLLALEAKRLDHVLAFWFGAYLGVHF